jgi:DnaK suppressor protein
LREVEEALKRLERGDYGVCVKCEEEISPARLKVRPEARLCLRCAS